jgi:hypothetical protein
MPDGVTIPHACPACGVLINVTVERWHYAGPPDLAKLTCPACKKEVQMPVQGRVIKATERPSLGR